VVLAFDAAAVQGARVAPGFRGREIRSLAQRPLDPGALRPFALETNLARPAEVREAARAVVAELGGVGTSGTIVLPDGVARLALVDVPVATDPREYAHFRLAPQLPYPASEAIVDVTPVGGSCYLAAAVRREVTAEYEAVAEAAGLAPDRVDLAPVAALAALRRRQKEMHLDVVLGDAAFAVLFCGDQTAITLRSRRRDPGPDEAERIGREVERTALLGPAGAPRRVRVVGPGARRVAEALGAVGFEAQAGWGAVAHLPAAATEELAWLAVGLA
jgi:hypothetical protein